MLPKSGTVVKMQCFIFSEAPRGTAAAVLPWLSPLLAVAANQVFLQSDANKVNYKTTLGDPTQAQQTTILCSGIMHIMCRVVPALR